VSSKRPFYNVQTKDGTQIFPYDFSFEESLGKDNYLMLKFQDIKTDFLDLEWLTEGTVLVFNFGFLGTEEQSQKRYAEILDIEPTYQRTIDVTVKCTDKGLVMKKKMSNIVWQDVTASDIAKTIAGWYGLETDIESTTYKYTALPQANRTDWELLKYLATQEKSGNFSIWINDNTLYFKELDLTKEATVTFTYADGNGKVISFKPKSKKSNQSSAAGGSQVTGFDLDTNTTTTEKADNSNLANNKALGKYKFNANGEGGYVKADDKNAVATGKNTFVAIPNKDRLKNTANSEVKKANLEGLEATLNLEGEPRINAGDIITIAGVAKRHLGNYLVQSVRHTISGGGFLTTLELKKNATAKNESAGKVSGSVNDSKGTDKPNEKKALKNKKFDANGKALN
jgi:phage protein D